MKFSTTTSALFSLLTLTSALPTEKRADNIIRPTVISQYSVWSGAVSYNTPTGLIFKSGRTSDITTLATFSIPWSTAGKTCELVFSLLNNYPPTGTAQFDVYTSLAPADHSTTDWPSGNLRDHYAGRLKAVANGNAVNVEGLPPVAGEGFPCPAGQLLAGELVGAGDQVQVKWDAATEGPYIVVRP